MNKYFTFGVVVISVAFGILLLAISFGGYPQATPKVGLNLKIANTPMAYAVGNELAQSQKLAQDKVNTVIPIGGKNQFNDFPDYLNSIVNQAIPIASALAVLMFIYAGFKYVTSAGDANAINEAKSIFVSTLTGVIMLLLISVIYYIVIQRWP